MKEIIIRTQKDWDNLPDSFDEYTRIFIRSTGWITVDKARGNSSVEAWGNSSVEAWGNSSVVAWGNSSVEARENSSVEARENSSVVAWGNSSVVARENSSVEARENSSVVARENSSVEAAGYVNVRLGRYYTKKPKLQHKARITKYPKSAKSWCSYWGLEVKKNKVILFKAVQENFTDFYTGKIKYLVGAIVKSPDWNPEIECGGGLHLAFNSSAAKSFVQSKKFKLLEVEVSLKDVSVHPDPDYPEKIKCKKVKVLREITGKGK